MSTIISTVLAGIIATIGMSSFMWLITKLKIANARMIRAIGSMFSNSYDDSFYIGFIVHFISGIFFAFVYVVLITILDPSSVAATIATGGMIGVAHGVAFGFLLVVVVAEHHPMEEFRNAGYEVAIAHFAGHVIYGLLIGLVVAYTGVRIVLI